MAYYEQMAPDMYAAEGVQDNKLDDLFRSALRFIK